MPKNDDFPEGFFVVDGKLFGICHDCGKLIRWNKPLLGSLHFCSSAWEMADKGDSDVSVQA